jgi:predicted chitinase
MNKSNELGLYNYAVSQGITGDELASFMAQTAHESNDFAGKAEAKYSFGNLKGFQAKADKEKDGTIKGKTFTNWVKRLKTDGLLDSKGVPTDLAKNLNKNNKLGDGINNSVYGGRKELGNGDYASGDGSKYRGNGFIQLTGRENTKVIGQDIGVDLLTDPSILNRDPDLSNRAAVAYWKRFVRPEVNDFTDTSAVTQVVNGGQTALKERQNKFDVYQPRVIANELKRDEGIAQQEADLFSASGGQAGTEVPPLDAPQIATLGLDSPVLSELYDMGVNEADARVVNLEEQAAAREALRLNQLQSAVSAGDAPGAEFNEQQAANLQQQIDGLQANPMTVPDYDSNSLFRGFDYAPSAVPPVAPNPQEVPLEMLTVPNPVSNSPDPRQMSLTDQRTYLMQNPNVDPRTVLAPTSAVPALYNNGTDGVKYYESGTNYATLGYDDPLLIQGYDAGNALAISRVEQIEEQMKLNEELRIHNLQRAVEAKESLGAEFNAQKSNTLARNIAMLNAPQFAGLGPVGDDALGFDFVPQEVDNNNFASVVAPALEVPNMHGMPQIDVGIPNPRMDANTKLRLSQPAVPTIENSPEIDSEGFSINNMMRSIFAPIGAVMDDNPLKRAVANGKVTMDNEAELERHLKQSIANQKNGVPGGSVPPIAEEETASGVDPLGLMAPKLDEVPVVDNTAIEAAITEALATSPAASDTSESSAEDNSALASLNDDYQNGKIDEAIALSEAETFKQKDPEASSTLEDNMKKYLGVGFADITKAVGYYLMSRATGASHEGSMRWAGKIALKSAVGNRATEKQIQALVDAGYTEASARSYSATKIAEILEKKNKGPMQLKKTGQTATVGITGIPGLNNVRGYEVDAGDTSGGKYNVFSIPSSFVDANAKPGEFTDVTEAQLMSLVARQGGSVLPFNKETDTQAGRAAAASTFTDSMNDEVGVIFSGSENEIKSQWPVALANASVFMQNQMGYSLNDPGVRAAAKVTLLTAMSDMKADLDSNRVNKVGSAAPYIKRVILTSAAVGAGEIWKTEDGKNQVSTTKTNQYWAKLEKINKDPAQVKSNFKKLYSTYTKLKRDGNLPTTKLTSPLDFNGSSTENEFSVWLGKTLDNTTQLNTILGG